MSSEHPLEEQELHRVDAGEQGFTSQEKELIALRNRVRELAKAEADWSRSARVAWREITNLKRRLTSMRNGLKGLAGENCLTEVDEYQRGAADDLKHDDAMRRRFERKERRRG